MGNMVSAVFLGLIAFAPSEAGIFVIDKPGTRTNTFEGSIKRDGSLSPKLEGIELRFAVTDARPVKISIELIATRKLANGKVQGVPGVPLLMATVHDPAKKQLLNQNITSGRKEFQLDPAKLSFSRWKKRPGLPVESWEPWVAKFVCPPMPGIVVEAKVRVEWPTPLLTLLEQTQTANPGTPVTMGRTFPLRMKGAYYVYGSSQRSTGGTVQESRLSAGRTMGEPWAVREGKSMHAIVFAAEPPALSNAPTAYAVVKAEPSAFPSKVFLSVRISPQDPFLKAKRL